ncbi:MAG: cyclic nucleotide-binding domain-containing protein [Gammaproteobacteria bacterium]|nr:cyclic nucleotide-binding domain-containing protein [Gammaproteobacteria bacterium]NNF61252.1 cyclic nucleotide-binding domain-containing protein [Gammaproteobacteria bacterium]
MSNPSVIEVASGARVVVGAADVVLFGQPPEIIKTLLQQKIRGFNALVLTDIREKGGALTNNLEFLLYYFLFLADGFKEGRKLAIAGDRAAISQALRLLRLTLTGPVAAELDAWGTDAELKNEWLQVANALALQDPGGAAIPVEDFFHVRPFDDDVVKLNEFTVRHTGQDRYDVSDSAGSVAIDLSADSHMVPPYELQRDYVPGGLVKLGLEVLGGASGFTPDEPCTGLALCHNGDYILIDAMPFLDEHLVARGIAKNQVAALFLTHLHDDHCTMFPLMLMPHVVEVITTREIFNMAMDKLACALGWAVEVVREHFSLFEVEPGVVANYYGLKILPHLTVHSIPTIGATFSRQHHGRDRQICIVGDNHSMTEINKLQQQGLVRKETVATLQRLYSDRFSLLVADGGAGAIHGDPEDALQSKSERVCYVHVEELANEFDTTFSLAVAGKRYTIIEGDPVLYNSQVGHYLAEWLDKRVSNRWLRSLLAESEIRRYNSDDVIVVQDTAHRDYVYLMLTGYCDVVQHDGRQLNSIARLQAGDLIGEMAAITGSGARNASVVARTPVTVCVFPEQNFSTFISAEGMAQRLHERWSLRLLLGELPCFTELTSTVLLRTSIIASAIDLDEGEQRHLGEEGWYLMLAGKVRDAAGNVHEYNTRQLTEFGWRPFLEPVATQLTALADSRFVFFEHDALEARLLEVPQLNYYVRKYRAAQQPVSWKLGVVPPL